MSENHQINRRALLSQSLLAGTLATSLGAFPRIGRGVDIPGSKPMLVADALLIYRRNLDGRLESLPQSKH